METEGKSPRYVGWLKTRLRFFNDYMQNANGSEFKLQDLFVDDGRDYIRYLMKKNSLYQNHPMHHEGKGYTENLMV